jgi:hypothetical protein
LNAHFKAQAKWIDISLAEGHICYLIPRVVDAAKPDDAQITVFGDETSKPSENPIPYFKGDSNEIPVADFTVVSMERAQSEFAEIIDNRNPIILKGGEGVLSAK